MRSTTLSRTYKWIAILIILTSCGNKKDAAFFQSTEAWHQERIQKLKAPNGWLNLVGLHWLDPGKNTFGSDSSNSIIFPKGKIAAFAGYFLLEENRVTLFANSDAGITHRGSKISSLVQFHSDSVAPIEATVGTLRWSIIKREEKLGVRLRDDASPLLQSFEGIERFPVDPAYRVSAVLEATDTLKTIAITNVLGQTTYQPSPGTLLFELQGKYHRLDVLNEGDQYFIVFADPTTGEETYGGGRFLYVDKPAPGTFDIFIDFNQAINPPCVFTPYATCPLPPPQNRLSVAIRAGEKNYGEHF